MQETMTASDDHAGVSPGGGPSPPAQELVSPEVTYLHTLRLIVDTHTSPLRW